MGTLDKYISELLLTHDCVIIPGFGGLVGNYHPAKRDSVSHRFSPPYKNISFNKNLANSDGLLANHIATQKGISYDEAGNEIEAYVRLLRSALEQHGRFEVHEVGTLYHDAHKAIRFEPDYSNNFLLDAFGLSVFHSLPVAKVVPIATPKPVAAPVKEVAPPIPEIIPLPAAVKEEKPAAKIREKLAEKAPENRPAIPQETEKRKKRKGIYLLYVAAIIPFLLYLAWLPLETNIVKDRSQFSMSDMNPFTSKIVPLYQFRNEIKPAFEFELDSLDELNVFNVPDTVYYVNLPSLLDDVEAISTDDNAIVVELRKPPVAKAVTTRVEKASLPDVRLRFHIIGGAFGVQDNAQGLVDDMRKMGYESFIVTHRKGLHHVSIESYATRQEALDALNSIRSSHNSGAWLMVK